MQRNEIGLDEKLIQGNRLDALLLNLFGRNIGALG